jgi:hypothetical protein
MHSISRNAVLALIGLTLVLHTVEEYLTFPAYLWAPSRMQLWLPSPVWLRDSHHLLSAMLMATVLPLGVIAWAMLRPNKGLLIAVLLLESVLLVNAAWHIFAAVVRGGYAPGLITAVLINLPFGIYVLRRAVRDQWIAARTASQLLAVAILLHIAAIGRLLAG